MKSFLYRLTAYSMCAQLALAPAFVQAKIIPTLKEHSSSPTSYRDLGNLYLPSLGAVQTVHALNFDAEEGPKLEIKEFTPRERLTELFKMLSVQDARAAQENAPSACRLNKHFLKDVEILCGNGAKPQSNLVAHVDNTVTELGRAKLVSMLAQPLNDKDALQSRQALIKALVEDKELFKQMSNLLESVKNVDALIACWQQDNSVMQNLINGHRSTLASWNKSAALSEVSVRLNNAGTALATVGPLAALIVREYIDLREQEYGSADDHLSNKAMLEDFINKIPQIGQAFIPQGIRDLVNDPAIETMTRNAFVLKIAEATGNRTAEAFIRSLPVFAQQPIRNFVEKLTTTPAPTPKPDMGPDGIAKEVKRAGQATANTAQWLAGKLNPKKYYNGWNDPSTFTGWKISKFGWFKTGSRGLVALVGLGAYGSAAFYGWWVKNRVTSALQDKDLLNLLQARLMGAAQVTCAAKDICKLVNARTEFNQSLGSYAQAVKLFTAQSAVSADTKNLVKLLQTSTFKGEKPSFFSLSGRVLAAHRLMETSKDDLVILMELVGEMDACLSAAKLVKKHQDQQAHYCFADFVTADKPVLKFEGFWNPFIPANKVVTNTIELGATQPRGIILTGSNTGGKSTLLKGAVMGTLLAHTFGIVPADAATLTPCSLLNTHLNVSDDTASGESRFRAEVLRAKELMGEIARLKPNQFAFVVIDELFTGTDPKKGEESAKDFTVNLTRFNNVMFVFATHYPELTKLESTFGGVVKNFCIEVFKDDAGNLVYPFTWKPGISTHNVAADIIKQELGANYSVAAY